MFVGLQGSGKTTSCTKLAAYYSRKGFKTGLVCTDTFRAGAYDQLKQNATKANVPFFGSYTAVDPVKLAREGVDKFKGEGFEVVIVDTSGRHLQETALFLEMKEISSAINPSNIIFVLDGAIGQAASAHAKAFKETVQIGSIILTKMDGHAKGGGAISAVASTGSPIIFIGTGEHIDDFESFEPTKFVNSMLGMGDLSGLLEKVTEGNSSEGLLRNVARGVFTFRDMKGQFEMISGLGPMSKIMNMIPGMSGLSAGMSRPGSNQADMDREGSDKLKGFTCILDSMTTNELDSNADLFWTEQSRIYRVSKGSGRSVREVEEVLNQHEAMAGMVKSLGGSDGMLGKMMSGMGGKAGGMPDMSEMMKGMGGMGGIAEMMKGMDMGAVMKGMSDMMSSNGSGPNPFANMFGGNPFGAMQQQHSQQQAPSKR